MVKVSAKLSLQRCYPDLLNLWDWEREREHVRDLRSDEFNFEGEEVFNHFSKSK